MKKILDFLKNKFFITSLVFIVWMGFFDPKDWGNIASKREKLRKLQESESNLKNMIADTRSELSALKTGASSIEKYARENYLMKKDNEDIFLVK